MRSRCQRGGDAVNLSKTLLQLPVNERGRDFVVGDVHGFTSQLLHELRALSFDFSTDRLICTGDVIDRGPESMQALDLLQQPWFFSVLGNHEVLMLSAMKYANSNDRMVWLKNGGEWIASAPPALWPMWFELLESLPLGIEVVSRSGRRYGVVHADYPLADWRLFGQLSDDDVQRCVWSRRHFESRSAHTVAGVDVLVHGHSVTPDAALLQLGNRWYIEPGAYKGNAFIIRELV